MSFISKIFNKSYSVGGDWKGALEKVFRVGSTSSGVHVNENSAMRYITVYSCMRVIAETGAQLPLFIYREKEGGGKEKARDHPAFQLLHDMPNDEMTSTTWRESQMGQQVLSGNAYSIITFNGKGNAVDLYPVPWDKCEPFRDQKDGKIKYRINDRGRYEVFPKERVLHVPGLGYDGLVGYSPVHMARESIGMGMAANDFAANFYGQGLSMGGVIEHPNQLSPTAHQNLREAIEEESSGMSNAGRPMILEEGMKFSNVTMPLKDAEFIETRKFNQTEICGLFRVPPHMIANLERATFSNIEHQSLEFVMYTLMPYLKKWEQAINWKLFTSNERADGYHAKFNVEGLLRGDYKSRQEGLAIQRQNGVISTDEWRAEEDRNPVGGEVGSTHLVNGNMISVEAANKQKTGQGGE